VTAFDKTPPTPAPPRPPPLPAKEQAFTAGVGDVRKSGKESTRVYVFDPTKRAAAKAFDALLGRTSGDADELAKVPKTAASRSATTRTIPGGATD